jgi:glycosyltransferase involved in cell wall biosynthesis
MPPLTPNAGRTLDIGVFGARGIPSTYSGYETFLTVLLPELARRGHCVTMYCRRGAVSGDSQSFRGVELRTLPSVRTKQLDTLSHGFLSAVAAAARRHDVVFACNIANVPFTGLLRRTGVPVVLNTDGQEWLRGKWGKAARSYFRWCARRAARAASALVSDCNAMRDLYADEFGADSTVIPYCWNGVVDDTGDDADAPMFATGSYFVTGGRMVPENNIDFIAEAYVETAHETPLVVVGEANYDSPVVRRLHELAAGDARIRPIGHVASRRGFRDLLANARAYLHGHSVGGMNPSLVEAMASRAAVVALDTPFNRETLGPSAICFRRDRDDVQRVVQQLTDLTVPELERYRDALQKRAFESFDLVSVADAYEQLFLAVSETGCERATLTTSWQVQTISSTTL